MPLNNATQPQTKANVLQAGLPQQQFWAERYRNGNQNRSKRLQHRARGHQQKVSVIVNDRQHTNC